MRTTIDWIVIIASAALVAAAARAAIPWMVNADGGFGPTVLNAVHPGPALAAVIAVVIVLFVVGIGAAARVGPLHAMGAIGAGLGWGALGLDSMRSMLEGGSGGAAAVDGVIWTGLILLLSVVMLRRTRLVEPDIEGRRPDPLVSPEALRGAAIGIIAGLLAAWLIARSDLRQQTAVAAVLGGLACGLAGRLGAPHVQPVLLPAALVLGGTLGGFVARMLLPGDLAGESVPGLLLPLPIDWAAGALLGVPMGFAAARGLLHHDDGSGEASSSR